MADITNMSWLSVLPKELLDLLHSYLNVYKLKLNIDDFEDCRSDYTGCCLTIRISKIILEHRTTERHVIFENICLKYYVLTDFLDFVIEHRDHIDLTPNEYSDYPVKGNVLDFGDWAMVYSENVFEIVIFDYKVDHLYVAGIYKPILKRIKFARDESDEIWRQLLEVKKMFEYIKLMGRLMA